MFVDSATTLGRVQELACALEDRILAMSQHTAISLDHLRKTMFGPLVIEIEPLSETLDIAFCDDDVFVGAAVRRTLAAVIEHWELLC